MELQIQHQELAPIQANLEQIKGYVQGVVAKYQNAAYTDEQMKLAKADRADLKRLKEDIDTKRKQVKSAWNAPYLEFESQIKAITALIDEPVALIDGQIKDWEERRKKARYNALETVFNKWNPFGPLLEFEKVVDAEMLKMSTTDSKATTLLTQMSVQPLRETEHKVGRSCMQHPTQVIISSIGIAHQQVVTHRSAEQRIPLRHIHKVHPSPLRHLHFALARLIALVTH